jgi:hypothetical protein
MQPRVERAWDVAVCGEARMGRAAGGAVAVGGCGPDHGSLNCGVVAACTRDAEDELARIENVEDELAATQKAEEGWKM